MVVCLAENRRGKRSERKVRWSEDTHRSLLRACRSREGSSRYPIPPPTIKSVRKPGVLRLLFRGPVRYTEDMKKKKALTIVAALLVVLTVALYFVLSDRPMSYEEMRDQFRCNRITNEVLETDKYCFNYELYKLDHAQGKI